MSNAPTLSSRTLNLPAFRFEQLVAALAKLGKKAIKLGCKAPVATITRSYTVDVSDDKKFPQLVEYNEIKIDYEVITVVGDWRFLASLETVDSVNGEPRNRVSGPNLSDEHAARFVTAHQKCDHCNHNRKRNLTFIVQSCNDETKQIGSTCLQAYMGIDPAAAVAGMEFATRIAEIGNDEERWGGKAAPRVMPLDEFAAATLSLVSKNGFVNAQAAEFGNQIKTGNDVITLLLDTNPRMADWRAKMTPTEEHKAAAAEAVKSLIDRILPAYINTPASLESFDFKVGISLNKGYVGVKDAQLVAAAIYYESGKIAKSKVGGVKRNELMPGAVEGQKLEFVGTIQSVKEVYSTFGASLLVSFVSESGHIVKTFYSGKSESFNTGSKVSVKGTVKKLEVSPQYGASVMLSRVKVG
jgi:hypothetical protein